MIYRTLGRTGLKVSQLGFGAMRLPMVEQGDEKRVDDEKAIPMIHRAFAGGVNYIDTAVGYCARDSQRCVGDAVASWEKPEEIVVSTKNHYYGEEESEWWTNLEDSLRLLKRESIDVYNMHGANWKRWNEAIEPRVGKWITQARDQGLIKHICCSYHGDCDGLIRLMDTGFVASVTLQYNLLDRSLEPAIAHAGKNDIGVVGMGPVAGGRLGVPSEVLGGLLPGVERVPELALRFVLANANVTVALSGMSTMEHVEENLAACAREVALSDEEKQAIDARMAEMKQMAELYCTGCGYCLPCPKEVAIPKIFQYYNWGRVYGLWDAAKSHYAGIGKTNWNKGTKVEACIECGACEDKCPQNIPIRKQLQEAREALAGEESSEAAG